MTPADVVDAVSRLKTGSRDGHRLPHKPLLVLLALGRWARGDRGPLPFAAVERPLEQLIRTYGPKGAGNPQDPFWRLRRDGLWELGGTAPLSAPAAVAPPGLRELRAGVTGQFAPGVRAALAADPALVGRLTRAVLDAHFPPSLHTDIAAAVGLDPTTRAETATGVATTGQRTRSPEFRDRVLRAYGNRCALCRVKLHVGLTPVAVGIEAAHIRWFAFDGPDAVTNGIALCAFHHKAFDLGAFTVELDGRVLVSAEVNGDGADVLLGRGPLAIESAACAEDRPAADNLAWHRAEVFRGRVRS